MKWIPAACRRYLRRGGGGDRQRGGWSANAPSGSISCSAGDAAPARRWRGRCGGGSFHMDRWSERKTRPAKESWLAGLRPPGRSAPRAGRQRAMATTTRRWEKPARRYRWASRSTLTCKICWPATARGAASAASAPRCRGIQFSVDQPERTRIGDQLRRSDADNQAIGGTSSTSTRCGRSCGTFSVSYNDDRRQQPLIHRDYHQTVQRRLCSLGLRAGIQRYNNGDSSANTGKYIAPDLSRAAAGQLVLAPG